MTSTNELRDADFEQLDKFLASVKGGAIPNTEALDGFFAALACCPDFVAPSEYMDVLLGEKIEGDDFAFGTEEEVIQLGKLVARHFNHVIEQLYSEVGYCPVLLEDDVGLVQANDWAKGFWLGSICAVGSGQSYSRMKSTQAQWFPSGHWLTRTILIRRCSHSRNPSHLSIEMS